MCFGSSNCVFISFLFCFVLSFLINFELKFQAWCSVYYSYCIGIIIFRKCRPNRKSYRLQACVAYELISFLQWRTKILNWILNASVRRHIFICWITLPADLKNCKITKKSLKIGSVTNWKEMSNVKITTSIWTLVTDSFQKMTTCKCCPTSKKLGYEMIYFTMPIFFSYCRSENFRLVEM